MFNFTSIKQFLVRTSTGWSSWKQTGSAAHTLAPEWMTNTQILAAEPYIKTNATSIFQRIRDGTYIYRGQYMGIDWEVTTDATGVSTASYPTGGGFSPTPTNEFTQIR